MPLKLSLKPGEKFVLNGAVMTNGDKRASLVIQNKASLLREKDIMQREDANTPARRTGPRLGAGSDGGRSEQSCAMRSLRRTSL